ncbi:hypothetical protein Tco_0822037 [Tanacetum coccineum]|uniref:Uncharacterized protein n=1 Tax=Tanacetum coccineum TaxID=301880 RepID=A0ABQ5AI59_9ASTR
MLLRFVVIDQGFTHRLGALLLFGNCTSGDPKSEPYIAAHNMILSHAAAVKHVHDQIGPNIRNPKLDMNCKVVCVNGSQQQISAVKSTEVILLKDCRGYDIAYGLAQVRMILPMVWHKYDYKIKEHGKRLQKQSNGFYTMIDARAVQKIKNKLNVKSPRVKIKEKKAK